MSPSEHHNKQTAAPAPETMEAGLALQAAKRALRTSMKTRLSAVSRADLEAQSRRVFEALQGLRPYRDAERISVYLSMPGGEVQTDAMVRHALGAGKEVFVPYLHKSSDEMRGHGGPKRVMDMVRLDGLRDYEGLERDAWGIPTVTAAGLEGRRRILEDRGGRGDEGGLHLVLMPGVAFDVKGKEARRLGHGKGFYDHFLHRYRTAYESAEVRSGIRMELYGLALKEQLLQSGDEVEVPVGPYDSLLDGLITGDGQIIEPASET